MIAPDRARGKDFLVPKVGMKMGKYRAQAITNSLNTPTITPNFGQSPVIVGWDIATVASWPGQV